MTCRSEYRLPPRISQSKVLRVKYVPVTYIAKGIAMALLTTNICKTDMENITNLGGR